MTENKPTYQEAFTEIQNILEEIENETISIDELSEKVKRASVLMKICRDKLRRTEESVQNILEQMKDVNKETDH